MMLAVLSEHEPSPPGAVPESHRRFEALVRQFGLLIRAAVTRVGGRTVTAVKEDVEQRVLLALWQQIDQEQTIEHPASYVYRAAVRETVRVLRREETHAAEPAGGDEEDDGASTPPATTGDPHDALQRKEWRAEIERGLAGLHVDRQRAVRAHLAGFDVSEIMNAYGWPYQKARNLIARGMADLREALRERGIGG
jgi:RNA polymerase sigma factor (sigma-70 family)